MAGHVDCATLVSCIVWAGHDRGLIWLVDMVRFLVELLVVEGSNSLYVALLSYNRVRLGTFGQL